MKTRHVCCTRLLAMLAIAVIMLILVGCGGGTSTLSSGGGNASGAKSAADRGQDVYRSSKTGCANCHKINGQGGAVGPELSHIATAATTRKSGMSAEDYLKESITDPSAFVVEGFPAAMQKYSLSDQELSDLVAYLMTLK